MFSKACEYGIRATIYIAQQSARGDRVSLKAVAQAIDSPVAFTAKILQSLARSEVIQSVKGPTGGYEIPSDRLDEVTLRDIVSAIDGDRIYNGCGLGLVECNELRPCPVHDRFAAIRDNLKKMLETTTVRELAEGLSRGVAFLKS